MKLKSFTPETFPVQRKSVRCFSIDTKTGIFRFSASAARDIGLSGGIQIKLLQDENEPENWYLKIDKGGFTLRETTNGLAINSAPLARAIADSVAFTDRSGRVLIGEKTFIKGVGDVWTLITASLRNK